MVDGIDNLSRLFAAEEIQRPESIDKVEFQTRLQSYKRTLDGAIYALNFDPNTSSPRGEFTNTLHTYYPSVTLEYALQKGIPTRNIYGRPSGEERPFGWGFHSASALFLDPFRYSSGGYEPGYGDCVALSRGGVWKFSDTAIMSERKLIVKSGGVRGEPVSGLKLYLDKLEGKIEEEVVAIAEDDTLVVKELFYYAPDIGLSLVGYAEALLKASQADPERQREYLELASRAYNSSGFRDMLYIGNRLLQIRELPPRTYVLVPVEKLPPDLRAEFI